MARRRRVHRKYTCSAPIRRGRRMGFCQRPVTGLHDRCADHNTLEKRKRSAGIRD